MIRVPRTNDACCSSCGRTYTDGAVDAAYRLQSVGRRDTRGRVGDGGNDRYR